MLILFVHPSALDPGPTPTQSYPLDQEADRVATGSRFKGGLPSLWSQVLEQPRPTGLLSLRPPSPRSPLPTCGHTTTRGGAARACIAAAPSAGASGRLGQRRTPYCPAHLQQPPRGLPGTRKGGQSRGGAGAGRLSVLPGHFRFCRGGACRAVMSRFKFVGKGWFSLALGLAGGLGSPLHGLTFRGCRGFRDSLRTGNE